MANKDSSLKDNIISGIIFLVSLGVVGWRYKDCKAKEAARDQAIAEEKVEAEQKEKGRIAACLSKTAEKDRTACVTCTCDKCGDEFEECWSDPGCRQLKLGDVEPGDGGTLSQLRLKARTECMVTSCRNACLGK